MGGVQRWTAREVNALRRARRESKRGFADKLGVTPRTITNWEGGRVSITPFSESLLDSSLAACGPDTRDRFEQYLADPASDTDVSTLAPRDGALADIVTGVDLEGVRDLLNDQFGQMFSDLFDIDSAPPSIIEALIERATAQGLLRDLLLVLRHDADSAILEVAGPAVLLAPPREPDMVHRSDADDVVALLAEAAAVQSCAPVVTLWGPGGFGKTTLATQICHDRRVTRLFSQILWVETGEHCTPARIVQLIGDLCVHLDGIRPAFLNAEQAGFHLARILGDRQALIVIDNVWSAADLGPFLLGGPRCVRLVTSRNLRVCPAQVSAVRLGPMSPSQIRELLTRTASGLAPAQTAYLADLCGGWPLLASIVGGNVAQEITAGAPQDRAVADAGETLQSVGPHALDVWDSQQRRAAIGQAISSSLTSLDETVTLPGVSGLRDRYLSLAIFPAATPIPVSVVSTWWTAAQGWTSSTVRQFCRLLSDRSLLSAYRADREVIVLHDVFRRYLRHLVAADWALLHRSLLDAYRPADGDWASLDPAHGYLWRHLPYHLREAGSTTELLELMARPAYIVAKADLCGPDALVADHTILTSLDETDTVPATTALALTGAGFLLGGLTHRRDIAATLLISLLRADAEHRAAPELRHIGDDPRSFGVDWVRGAVSAESEKHGHVGAVTTVASHGSVIASGGEDGTVKLWSIDQQQRPRTYAGHTGWVFAVAISADGLLVASAGDDAMIRLWDTRTDTSVGSLVAHTRRVRALAFTRTGRTLVSAGEDGHINVWDTDRLSLLQSMQTPGCPIWSITVSSDDSLIAAAGEDEYLRLYDLQSGQLTDETAAHRDWIRAVCFASRAPILAAGSGDGTATVWDITDRQLTALRRLPQQPTRVRAVTLSPDGGLLVTAGEDATLRAYTGDTPVADQPALPHVDWIRALAHTDRDSIIVGCEDGSIRTWNPATKNTPTVLSHGRNTIWSATFAHHGQLEVLGLGDGTIDVRDTAGQPVRVISAGTGRVWSLAAGGDHIAAACGDGTVRVWSLTDHSWTAHLNTNQRRTWAVAVNTGGTRLATSTRGAIQLWDLPSAQLLWTRPAHTGERIRSLAFDATGDLLLSGGGDGNTYLWDVSANQHITALTNPGSWVRAVAINQTGRRAAIGYGSGDIHVHDLTTNELAATLIGHNGRPLMLGFTTHADQLVTAAADGTVRSWSINRQQQDAEVRITASLHCAAHTADTNRVLAGSATTVAMLTCGDATEKG